MKKKIALVAIASLLIVCAVAATATFALYKQETTVVKNTFVATKGLIEDPDPDDPSKEATFAIYETEAKENADGTYRLEGDAVIENEYKLLPGTTIPKDPYIVLDKKSDVPAYLYVEVVTTLTDEKSIIGYSIDTSNWVLLSGITGPNGGTVYAYTNGTTSIVDENSDVAKVNILANQQVTVADVDDLSSVDGKVIEFYGYLAQASAGTAQEAFDACFLGD